MYYKFLKLRENIDSYMKMNYPNKMITLDLQYMIFLSFKFCVWILSGQWCSMIQWNVSRMPKHRAPAPPGDQIPDTQAPPPPLPLNSRHSSSSQSLRSNTSSTSEMGHNSFDRRQDPKRLPYFFSNFTSQEEVFI